MKIFLLALLLPLQSYCAGKIINADIAASGTANIALNKLAASTAHNACTFDSSGYIAGGVAPGTSGNFLRSNGTDWASSALTSGNLTDAGTDGIIVTNGTGAVLGSGTSFAQHVADSTHNGYLSSTDWSTFNGKQAAGNYITALTGDVTASGPGSVPSTVAKIQGTTVSGTTGTTNVVFSSSPTMSNPVVGTQSQGDASTKAASTAYVDTAIANAVAGVNPAVSVKAATTQASDTSGLTYNNGAGGIGAFFTGSVNTAITFDGITFTALGQRALIKNDTQSPSGAFNGVYYITQLQTAILAPILTRALDYDMPSDINNTGAIPVVSGTVNASTSWLLTSSVTTVGTDALTYTRFSINPTTILTNALTSAHLFVGNVSNVATDVAMSGDATMANNGAVTLATVNSNVGSFTNANVTVNAKGQVTAAANGTTSANPDYWSGNHAATCNFVYTGSSFANAAADSTCSLTTLQSNNMTVTSYKSGSDFLPGIVFTPAHNPEVYYVCAEFNYQNSTTGSSNDLRLWDGTNTINQVTTLMYPSNTNQWFPMEICGIYASASGSAVTLSIQGAISSGTATLLANGPTGTTPNVQWSIFQIK